jgi:flagellar hook assembly protein FlgD
LELTTDDTDIAEISKTTSLKDNYPNPFNPSTTIKCEIKKPENGTIEIFNIKGQKIKTLHNGYLKPGEHSFVWNGTDDSGRSVSSGIYFYKMTTRDFVDIKKMMLLK